MLSRPALPILRPTTRRDLVARLVPVGLLLLALLTALFCGWATAHGHSILVAPIIGIALYVILVHTTLAPYALILLGASTFTSAYALPRTAHFYPVELLVLLGLSLLPFAHYRSFGGGAGVLVVVLLLTTFGGVVVARVNGIAVLTAIDQARPMFLYLTFWVALAAFRQDATRFLKLLAAFAVVIPLLQLAQVLLPGHNLFRSAGEAFVSPSSGGFTRVRPPGLVLVYFGLIFSFAYLLWGPSRGRRRAVALAAVTALGILISLNRNMMVGAVAGLFVVLLVTRRRSKAFVMLGGAAVVVAAVLAFAGSGAIGSRILSLGSPSGLQQSTLSDREYENSFAVPVIERHLVFGIGWGATFGAYLYQPGGVVTLRTGVHNQYYDLLLRTGIVGLVAYLGLLGGTAAVAIRWIRRRADHDDGWLGAALLASVVAFAASSIVGLYVLDAGSAPIAATLFALAVLMRERLAVDRSGTGEDPQNLLEAVGA